MIKAEIRFKNATFMNALENSKYKSIAELSRVSGIRTGTLYHIASLKHTNISTQDQTKLAEMLNCDVYDLFEQYEEVIKKSKGYPKKITKDIPIDSMLSLSSKNVMQLESDYNTDDIDNRDSLIKDMKASLFKLKDRERDVIELHFGLNGKCPTTLDGIALEFGLTRERVRQIKEKAIRKLRHKEHQKLRGYVRNKDIGNDPTKETYSSKYSRELKIENRRINESD
tara:strand:- start:2794 stop:3471 length:678 start_codon:yes stop_codon:yes gene_type:complete